MTKTPNPLFYVENIRNSGLTIYDEIEIGDPQLWIPAPALEAILNRALRGLNLAGPSLTGLPLKTRSKVVKTAVCNALGYPVPGKFTRTKPRFPGQFFDTYAQESNNLQVYNEELAPTRRYVIVRVSDTHIVQRVKVVTGDSLSKLDTTGKLTQKYQARLVCKDTPSEFISPVDTTTLRPAVNTTVLLRQLSPTANPIFGEILPIAMVFKRLSTLIGASFADPGTERRRGAELHRLVCTALGYASYADDGRFPDVRNQVLEVKLQTSPTIDLGLVRPNSKDPLDIPKLQRNQLRHCDVRYALFFGKTNDKAVTITHFFLTTGEAFFSRFPQCRGKVLNKKLQIPLPVDFFD